jgi:hypothetical protein
MTVFVGSTWTVGVSAWVVVKLLELDGGLATLPAVSATHVTS